MQACTLDLWAIKDAVHDHGVHGWLPRTPDRGAAGSIVVSPLPSTAREGTLDL
jgi:hypothetical protein